MTTTDPIADLLTRIRNACMARQKYADIPFSKVKANICLILKNEGFIKDFRQIKKDVQGQIRVYLKYDDARQPIINGLKRMSKPGLRKYVAARRIPTVLGKMGIAIVSTSKGIVEGEQAKKNKVGGELLCLVW